MFRCRDNPLFVETYEQYTANITGILNFILKNGQGQIQKHSIMKTQNLLHTFSNHPPHCTPNHNPPKIPCYIVSPKTSW